ncbi:MAG TPA: hypothetical protein VFP71_09005 [Candidatus Angelobacter sp.]|nr:hypothetical protein [Candidatus Angelobacter sp.]
MAGSKRTRSRKQRTKFSYFPEVKGKTVESVEIDPDVQCLTILFSDKTALSFDLDPMLVVFPELASLKTGNWRCIKRWPALRSKISMVEWP